MLSLNVFFRLTSLMCGTRVLYLLCKRSELYYLILYSAEKKTVLLLSY